MVLGSGIRDPGSEIRDPRSEIRDPRSGIRDPDPGSRGQKGTGSRIRIRNTEGHDLYLLSCACSNADLIIVSLGLEMEKIWMRKYRQCFLR
jgi:hypothetical protein